MKPFRLFLFFLFVLSGIMAISLSFPGFEWRITGKWFIKIPDPVQFVQAASDNLNTLVGNDSAEFLGLLKTDSVHSDTDTPDTSSGGLEPTVSTAQPSPQHHLYFPGRDTTLLYPLFKKMEQARHLKGGIRILYYGDSQIEGDRITAYLRKKLQARFGGHGPGLISPRMVVSYTQSVQVSGSANWRRYTLMDYRESIVSSNRFGILLNYCSFTAPYEHISDDEIHTAYIKITPARMGYDNSEVYRVCRILTDDLINPLDIDMEAGEQRIHDRITQRKSQILSYTFNAPVNQLEIHLRASRSPRIFGISLDDTSGIALDNIPLRGSRGTDFSRTDTAFLRQMYHAMNVELIILHFGVNVAMHVVEDYTYYENVLFRELMILKQIADCPILVIGISDMYVDGGARTLPNLLKIRAAQKNATLKAQGIFYDLYTAMGGEGSMKIWVASDPPLARSDHIHFSREGADFVARMIYEELMNGCSPFETNR